MKTLAKQTVTTQRKIAFGTLGVLSATMVGGALTATPAQADANLWKNIAIGAGAVTAYGLVKGNNKVAAIGGIAAVGSYLKYNSDKKKEDQQESRKQAWYKQRYGSDWKRHYR